MTHIDGQLLEFLNQNMHRNYPIQDTCIVQSDSGEYLPSSFLVDAKINVPVARDDASIDVTRFFISAVEHYSGSVQVMISYVGDNGTPFVCGVTGAIVLAASEEDTYPTTVQIVPGGSVPEDSVYDPLREISGELYIGTTFGMTNLGSLKFSHRSAALWPTCINKMLQNVTDTNRIIVLDSDGNEMDITGTVYLRAGNGILFHYIAADNQVEIRIDRTWLSNKIKQILSSGRGMPIMTINGKAPDSDGGFWISGLDCTDVNDAVNGITISNPCSKPCCGEDSGDVAEIKAAQELLADKISRVSTNIDALIISMNNAEARLPSLVASRK